MISADTRTLDPLTGATVTVAGVLVLNKPFYPLYVWYLVGSGVQTSLASLIATPFFLAIPFVARRSSLAARVALPLIGTLDTVFETKVFGTASGTELFFAACILLVALSFRPGEAWWQRFAAIFVFVAFVFSRNWIGMQIHNWSSSDLSILLNLNAFAVASLTTFISLRYAGIARHREPGAADQ